MMISRQSNIWGFSKRANSRKLPRCRRRSCRSRRVVALKMGVVQDGRLWVLYACQCCWQVMTATLGSLTDPRWRPD